jgi:hypothetical protein
LAKRLLSTKRAQSSFNSSRATEEYTPAMKVDSKVPKQNAYGTKFFYTVAPWLVVFLLIVYLLKTAM